MPFFWDSLWDQWLWGEGKMKVAMGIASGSFLLNIVLDPILIAWAGWGIQGAAWATVIAQVVYFLCQVFFHWKGETRLRLMASKIRISGVLTTRVIQAGMLAIIRQVLVFVPLVIIFRALMQVQGIWLSMPVTDALTALLGFVMVFRQFGRLKERTAE